MKVRGYEEGVTRQRTQAPLEARKGKETNGFSPSVSRKNTTLLTL